MHVQAVLFQMCAMHAHPFESIHGQTHNILFFAHTHSITFFAHVHSILLTMHAHPFEITHGQYTVYLHTQIKKIEVLMHTQV